MILRKKIWRVILILLVVSIGVISIIFIFHSFKTKPHNKLSKNYSANLPPESLKKNEFDYFDYNKFKQEYETLQSFTSKFNCQPPLHPSYEELEYQGKTLPISSVGTN